jgi:hydroxyacylglutathione hydrolase
MEIEIFKSDVSDNFFYALTASEGQTVLIDPVDGKKAVTYLNSREDLELNYVVNTHFHHDHIDGNDFILDTFPEAGLKISQGDAAQILETQPQHEQRAELIGGGDKLSNGELSLQVYDTPGHTPGHVSLLCQDALFSGDTIFVGGAGNCNFGGDPGELFETFRDVLSELGDEATFYPGHDYTRRNCEFILSLETANASAEGLLEKSERKADDEIILTKLGTEKNYNPFFRYDDDHLQALLEDEHGELFDEKQQSSYDDQEAVFRTIRALRDRW